MVILLTVIALLLSLMPAVAQTAVPEASVRYYYYLDELIPVEVAPEVIAALLKRPR